VTNRSKKSIDQILFLKSMRASTGLVESRGGEKKESRCDSHRSFLFSFPSETYSISSANFASLTEGRLIKNTVKGGADGCPYIVRLWNFMKPIVVTFWSIQPGKLFGTRCYLRI
jgi:hypothetical protein